MMLRRKKQTGIFLNRLWADWQIYLHCYLSGTVLVTIESQWYSAETHCDLGTGEKSDIAETSINRFFCCTSETNRHGKQLADCEKKSRNSFIDLQSQKKNSKKDRPKYGKKKVFSLKTEIF